MDNPAAVVASAEPISFFGYLTAFATAALVTALDLDRSFFIPKSTKKSVFWYLGIFVMINAVISTTVFAYWKDLPWFIGWRPSIVGIVVGFGYLAILRSRIIEIPNDQALGIPIGPEIVYEWLRGSLYRRVNFRVRDVIAERIKELLTKNSAPQLLDEANLLALSDAIPDLKRKDAHLKFLHQLEHELGSANERDQLRISRMLAYFIITVEVPREFTIPSPRHESTPKKNGTETPKAEK